MNPRYRRLLIPGLLLLLVTVVVVSALLPAARAVPHPSTPAVNAAVKSHVVAGPADEDDKDDKVSVIRDKRIPESSALVVSTRDPELGYTVNDSGNDPIVFTLELSSGDVVGTTRLTGHTIKDTEALAIDSADELLVADIGDNDSERNDIAIYALAQPGRGDGQVRPTRYPLRYSGGPTDAEALLADPTGTDVFVVSKGLFGGELYRLPADLVADEVNIVRPVPGVTMPLLATDGGYYPDGSRVLVRNYIRAYAYDPATWERTWARPIPPQEQGESLAVEPDGQSFLVGTEGLPSPLLRLGLGRESREQPTRLFDAGGIIDASVD